MGYVAHYNGPHSNNIFYVTGDSRNTKTWDHMAKQVTTPRGPMNLVLIDGWHTGEFVKTELDSLANNGIIGNEGRDKDFAVIWDDCETDIKDAVFQDSFPKLYQMFVGRQVCSGSFLIHGWVGEQEKKHSTCVFTTLNIGGAHLEASDTWTPERPEILCERAVMNPGPRSYQRDSWFQQMWNEAGAFLKRHFL